MKKESKDHDGGALVPGKPAPKTLGEALTQLLNNPDKKGRHAKWLAEELGYINGGIISHWCHGRHRPRPDTLKKVADLLGVPFEKLHNLPTRGATQANAAMKWIEVGGKVLRVNEATGETSILTDNKGIPEWKAVKE